MEEARAKLQEDPDDWTSHLILAMLSEWNPEISAEEHLAVVEEKAPETADTYYLRSYTVDSVAEQIALLDRALELDPGHGDALFWRVIKHTYATKDFKAALRDSERMIAVRPRSSHGRMLLSQVLKEQRDWEQAILEINRAIELDPEDPMNFYWRAFINWNTGRYDDAVADADRTVALGPRSPGFHWLSAAVSNVFGKHDDAVIKARSAIELDPDHRDAYGVLFSALWSMKQEDELREAMDQLRSRAEVWADDEARAGAQRQLSEWNRTLGNLDQALADAEQAIELDPDNYRGYHKRALVRQKLEGRIGIREDCELLAALDIEDVGDDLARANLLRVFCERPDEALASITAVIERARHWADPYNERAWLYINRSQNEKAIRDLNTAIELAPAWAALYNSRSWCHRNEKLYDEAWADIGRAIELAPEDTDAIFVRALLHMDAERFEEALIDLESVSDEFPRSGDYWAYRALALLRLGREEEALAIVDRVVENMRENERVNIWRGLFLGWMGREDEAIASLNRTTELFPKSAWPYSVRARVALGQPGTCEKALADLETASEHAPDDVELMSEIAWVHASLVISQCPNGYNADLALNHAEKSMNDNPKSANRQNVYGWVLYRQGRYGEAREALLKAMDRRIPEPEPWDLFGLAMTEWKLGNKKEARDYYDRAVARAEHTFPKFPEFTLLKEEAAELLGVQP
jgi:tetratricopeptide (TPR) repeat protein